jgi:hypothetical protein
LEKRAELFLPGNEGGCGEEGEGRAQQGEMAQTMYAHMNKLIKKKKKNHQD